MLSPNWTSRASLQVKIIGLSVTLLVLMTGAGTYSLHSMSNINDELVAIAEQDIPLAEAVTEITVSQLEQAIRFERALRYGEEMQENERIRIKFDAAVDAFDKYSSRVNDFLVSGEALATRVSELAHSEENRQKFKRTLIKLEEIDASHLDYERQARKVFGFLQNRQTKRALELADAVEAEEDRIDHALETLLHEIESFTESAATTAQEHEQHAATVLWAILGFSLVTGVAVSAWISRDLIRRVSYAVSVAETIASGDLRSDVIVGSTDEIGRLLLAMQTMRENLHSMVTQMSDSSDGLSVSAEQLSTTTTQMTASVESQRDNLQLVATAFNEMTATAQEVAQNAGTTAAYTAGASTDSEQGRDVIKSTVRAIQSLAEAVEGSASAIGKLGQDSETISAIIDVIKGIAEQTNLLALNAAIEAARAGEQGRGFAVVADEVRTLAKRTQESTSEIEAMIDRLQASARSAVETMESGRSMARSSVEQVLSADRALESIATAVGSINDMNTQIAAAAEEQTQVSEEINRNVTAINEAAEQNAASMTQTSDASEELAKMATSLQTQIRKFQVS